MNPTSADIHTQQATASSLRSLVATDPQTIEDLIELVLMSGAYLKLSGEWDLDTAYEVSQHVHDIAERLFERHQHTFNHQTLTQLSGHPNKFPSDNDQDPDIVPAIATIHAQVTADLTTLQTSAQDAEQREDHTAHDDLRFTIFEQHSAQLVDLLTTLTGSDQ